MKNIDYSNWNLDRCIPAMVKCNIKGKQIPEGLQASFNQLAEEYIKDADYVGFNETEKATVKGEGLDALREGYEDAYED